MSRPTSFYYAFLVLPKAQREAIIAVWDFCRTVDDVVDEGEAGTSATALKAALDGWREELARCYDGTPLTAQGRSLQPRIREFNLSRQPFDDLIDGVAMDLDHVRYADFEALHEYCWRVASTVGLICIEIFGQRSAAAREYATNLGIALQLTNILRDVRPDAARGRIYLPLADLARFGCTEADVLAGAATPALKSLLRFEAARARQYYARAANILPSLDAQALMAAEIMARVYRDILDRIEAAGYDVFSRRIRVPRVRRALLAAGTWVRTRFRRHAHA